jgi:hypothetical protein
VGGESHRMRRHPPHAPTDERFAQAPDLERQLLRVGVGVLAAGRARCRDCGRTPLIGEEVHLYEGEVVVCELCRPRHLAAPVSIERVRHSEFGQAVRLKRAA